MSKEYHAAKANPDDRYGPVSKSTLWAFDKSPWKWAMTFCQDKPTAAMQLGTIVHAIALQPDDTGATFVVSEFDSFRTKEAKEWRDENQDAGKIVLTKAEYETASLMACRATAEISKAVGHDEYDTEVEVHSEFNGVKVCGLIDIVPDGKCDYLWDLKTCSAIGDGRALQRTIFDFGYHVQGSLYSDLWAFENKRGMEPPGFGFIFVETKYPHEATWITLSADAMSAGRARYICLIDRWKQLRDTPVQLLPGTVEAGTEIDAPAWAIPV